MTAPKIILGIIMFLISTLAVSGQSAFKSIKYDVSPIKQKYTMSCWAAATSILHSWKYPVLSDVPSVLKRAGTRYESIYAGNKGITPAQESAFYKTLGLVEVAGLSPTPAGWSEMLRKHGPLSVTVDAAPGQNLIHAIVVVGLEGDGSLGNTIITTLDPADGKKHTDLFEVFLTKYDGAATWPLQIVHWP